MLLIKYVRNEDCKKCLHIVTSCVVKTHIKQRAKLIEIEDFPENGEFTLSRDGVIAFALVYNNKISFN